MDADHSRRKKSEHSVTDEHQQKKRNLNEYSHWGKGVVDSIAQDYSQMAQDESLGERIFQTIHFEGVISCSNHDLI